MAPLRRANPQRFREARAGHLAVVAMAGRPWFIGRICELSGPTSADFTRVLNIDTGEIERIPAPWIVELMGGGGLLNGPYPRQRMLSSRAD